MDLSPKKVGTKEHHKFSKTVNLVTKYRNKAYVTVATTNKTLNNNSRDN
jgi:hypothetical protein